MKVYPIYLNRLDEKKTVLIGGDHEAERKARELLECDANITLISPKITEGIQTLADEHQLKWIPRTYQYGDLADAFLVIVAQFHNDINKQVHREAEERGILVNVMDDIPHCNFTFGSLVKRGRLTISVSTSGAAPTLAVRLRQKFEKEFGAEYAPYLDFMQHMRTPMAKNYDKFSTRKRIWYELIDSEILSLFRENRIEDAIQVAKSIAGSAVVEQTLESQELLLNEDILATKLKKQTDISRNP
jgi:precorrin-2 dehydrogenase / sirohydrochlorin ferrochelatase